MHQSWFVCLGVLVSCIGAMVVVFLWRNLLWQQENNQHDPHHPHSSSSSSSSSSMTSSDHQPQSSSESPECRMQNEKCRNFLLPPINKNPTNSMRIIISISTCHWTHGASSHTKPKRIESLLEFIVRHTSISILRDTLVFSWWSSSTITYILISYLHIISSQFSAQLSVSVSVFLTSSNLKLGAKKKNGGKKWLQ